MRVCAVQVKREAGQGRVCVNLCGVWWELQGTLGESQIVNCTCYLGTVVALHRLMQCMSLASLEKRPKKLFYYVDFHLHWSILEVSFSEPKCVIVSKLSNSPE